MRHALALAALLVALVAPVRAAASTPPAPTTATEDQPTRVLIMGDSITQGYAGDVTWRYHLWDTFRGNVDLVGPKQGQHDEESDEVMGQYPRAFDYDHASRWGMWMAYPDWSVTELVETHDADVLVEQLGIQDIWFGNTPEGLAEIARRMVAEARAGNPAVDVVLGQLTQTWDPTIQEFNALLPDLAGELDDPVARVVVAVMPAMTADGDTYDGAHPNAAGEARIAAAHEAALVSLGVEQWAEPAAAPLPAQPVLQPPAPPARVMAVRKGARVKVAWRPASGAASYVARCGRVSRETTGLRVRLRTTSQRCRVRAVNAAGASPWVAAVWPGWPVRAGRR